MAALREGGHGGEAAHTHVRIDVSCTLCVLERVGGPVNPLRARFRMLPAATEVHQRHFRAALAGLKPQLDAAELSKYENWGRQ